MKNRNHLEVPEKYWAKQNLCWYFHEIIVSILDNCITNNKMETEVVFKSEEDAEKFQKSDDKILWLYKNRYIEEAKNLVGKNFFNAILREMCEFICESINALEKGKISVALSLQRKAFGDNLLYLEWLLGEEEKFLQLVANKRFDKYAVENISTRSKIDIMRDAIKKLDNQAFFSEINVQTYYDMRYHINSDYSLQRIWDKVNILSTDGHFKKSTELNFVFSDEDNKIEYIDYYYKKVLILLYYTYNVVIKLYERFIRKLSQSTKAYNYSLISYKFTKEFGNTKSESIFKGELSVFLSFICDNCKSIKQIDVNSEDFHNFENGSGFYCDKCGEYINTSRYIFLEDY
ncbi:hypothetical protein [Clostridium fungisolvens]|uniref:Uncharacterized protein n=1 Tax=Clostridium fungisolvens TaxID=1604897 RepID=A0A6V8SF15_9CLOT|nr:hypothetical protein [Clostridium fungisolvens]GFP75391.1 hypothetical protein bsdtw1_01471 [Clostridium fungisolvens]